MPFHWHPESEDNALPPVSWECHHAALEEQARQYLEYTAEREKRHEQSLRDQGDWFRAHYLLVHRFKTEEKELRELVAWATERLEQMKPESLEHFEEALATTP